MERHADDEVAALSIEGLCNLFALKTGNVFDLRRTAGGHWCMRVPVGDSMETVHGSIKPTIREVLEYCLDRWAKYVALFPTAEDNT